MIGIICMKTPEKNFLCINPKVVNFSVDICDKIAKKNLEILFIFLLKKVIAILMSIF